ncbi:Threonine-phosphate decarboxylase [bioreactor metagenome]|uniref:Threonine-phosphate decarboxylase n=1 Tax=bioreactor metagenome TaxID=1076179 RepID=A0A644YVX5_9ZZZZ
MKHGGDVYSDGLLKGTKLLDYSSNINPLPISKEFSSHIDEALNNVMLYPDVKYRTLKDNIITYLQASEEYFSKENKGNHEKNYLASISRSNILVGNGASEVLDLIISSLKSITIVVPSFVEYEDFSKKHGVKINYAYVNEDMEYDYKEILSAVENTEALIIGNPNNPNGCIINFENFEAILKKCEEQHKLVIIDEAFIEFVLDYDKSLIKYIDKYSSLVIIRAITKFYGMPGIRFGYGITRNEKLLRYFSNNQNPWSVNCFAELAVKYALKDEEFISKSKLWIEEERSFMEKSLNSINFIEKVYISYGNYFLCKLKYISSYNLYEKMMKRGILIRNCDNYKGLNEYFIRLAVKDRKSNETLIKVLKDIEKEVL